MIYLDNAATTLKKPSAVKEAMLLALDTMGNSSRGAHDIALNASRTVYEARERLAAFFNCTRPDHVIFTSNITESLNIVLSGLLEAGDHVISTELEHNSVLRPLCRLREERNVAVDLVSSSRRGLVDYSDFERLMRPETKLVVCTHASNLTGNVLDISRIAQIAHSHNALFAVDSAQTAGTRKVDMQKHGIDVLCFTGHKGLLGPQGTGGICIREGVDIKPFKSGGTGVQSSLCRQPDRYPARLEAGTLNSPGIAGLAAAVDFIASKGLNVISEREALLTLRFYEKVRGIPGITVYGDFEGEHAGIVSLNVRDLDSGLVSGILSDEFGIATRPGLHCAPLLHRALGTKAQGAVRFSFSCFTEEAEIDRAAAAVKSISERPLP
ncbi:MAG TPA: cysteine desulfurase [Lachnospiraceae bacterium]|nr:cysteine desulfurase [Lachnospiraceae bacterium]